MKRLRKCDTSKYRHRRKREQVAHIERVKRRRREDMERARSRQDLEDRYLAVKREYHRQEQALVNVLARRLYQLSPEHAALARAREAIQVINSVWQIFR